ncbi:protein phosphatase 2C domain-containing protein (plasmid) [Cupriavidus sp. P-10]|nr:protein phosphatase 2C domain-containing protein [Cupriavidus sp. P-10]
MPVLAVFVSDGAGSAQCGGEGAELAIQTAAAFIVEQVQQAEFALTDAFAVSCVTRIRETLYARADTDGLKARDFACTFLGVVSLAGVTLAMQIGDGGIVLDTGAGLEVAIVPMSGEYANMTHFVTDEDAVSILQTRGYLGPARKVAVFTDGIQRLALNMTDNTPHEPFFTHFFKVMEHAKAEQQDQLDAALVKFLSSSAVNERTDDDKTLALAVQN